MDDVTTSSSTRVGVGTEQDFPAPRTIHSPQTPPQEYQQISARRPSLPLPAYDDYTSTEQNLQIALTALRYCTGRKLTSASRPAGRLHDQLAVGYVSTDFVERSEK